MAGRGPCKLWNSPWPARSRAELQDDWPARGMAELQTAMHPMGRADRLASAAERLAIDKPRGRLSMLSGRGRKIYSYSTIL